MRLGQVMQVLSGRALNQFNQAREVEFGFETALLSDVLAHAKPHTTLILTEITNPQVVRTAEMVDAAGVLFVKNKTPDESTLRLATEIGIPLIVTRLGMFEACGKLYAAGVEPARKVD
jgi:tRNA G18 (ribose-2'-O)-methylase SpoU